jgi:hypothetical protein
MATNREEELDREIKTFLQMHRSMIDACVADKLSDIVDLAKAVGAQREASAMLRIGDPIPDYVRK